MTWLVILALAATLSTAQAANPDGARLYRQYCAGCHGPDGRGDGRNAGLFLDPPRDLRDGVLERYDAASLVRRIQDGRPLALPLDPKALRTRLGDLDDVLAHLERLAHSDPGAVRRGTALWNTRCARCHGEFGTPPPGVEDPPRDLMGLHGRLDGAALRDAIRHGAPGMPAIEPPVTETESEDLAVYFRLLTPGLPVYAYYCEGCHGMDGRGADLPSTLGPPRVPFDANWLATTKRRERETAVWHMLAENKPQMPHFRQSLSDEEARAIVDWLRTRQVLTGTGRTPPPR